MKRGPIFAVGILTHSSYTPRRQTRMVSCRCGSVAMWRPFVLYQILKYLFLCLMLMGLKRKMRQVWLLHGWWSGPVVYCCNVLTSSWAGVVHIISLAPASPQKFALYAGYLVAPSPSVCLPKPPKPRSSHLLSILFLLCDIFPNLFFPSFLFNLTFKTFCEFLFALIFKIYPHHLTALCPKISSNIFIF